MKSKTIKELSIELTVEITAICDNIKGRSVFVNQLLRACSSIGANSHEAKYAQSTADFINKLEVALKECYETEYWLEILYKVKAINDVIYKSLSNKCGTIRKSLLPPLPPQNLVKTNAYNNPAPIVVVGAGFAYCQPYLTVPSNTYNQRKSLCFLF